MPEFLIVAIVLVAIVFIARAVHRHGKRVDEGWTRAADSLGLEFYRGGTFGKRRIQGEIDGHRVKVDVHARGGGQSRHTVTRYQVYYPQPLGLGLRLKKEAAFYGVARFFGAQDIQVGDAGFDEKVTVKGAHPSRVVEFLTPSRRLRILRLFQALEGAEVQDAMLTWSSSGVESNPSRMAATVRRMVRVAGHLHRSVEEDRPLDRAMEAQREGRLEKALELVRQVPAAASDPDTRAVEGEILYTGRRFQEAAEAFRHAVQEDPDDPDLQSWAHLAATKAAAIAAGAGAVAAGVAAARPDGEAREGAAGNAMQDAEPVAADAGMRTAAATQGHGEVPETRPATPGSEVDPLDAAQGGTVGDPEGPERATALPLDTDAAPEAPAGEARPDPPASDAGPESGAVCQELFDGKILSLDANRRFEERYQGRRVRWSGTLRQARGYTFDMVFGSEPGTKLVVELHEIEGGAFARTVQAVIQLPAGLEKDLAARAGQEITFEGVLTSCDAFMRNLFVTGGRLVEGAS